MSKFTLDLVNQVGMSIGVNAETIEDLYDEMRRFGSMGWTSGDIPAGGYRLPYEMADTFDFALIGAREFTISDKETGEVLKCVEHRGHVYKRRDLPATNKIKKAVIKYSRGARPVDDDATKEGSDDAVQYVTLIQFEGKGHAIYMLQKKPARAAAAPPAATHTPPARQATAATPAAEPAKANGAAAGVAPTVEERRPKATGSLGIDDTPDEAELERLNAAARAPANAPADASTDASSIAEILQGLSEGDRRRIKAIAESKGLWAEPYAKLRLIASTLTEPGEPLAPEQGDKFFKAIFAEPAAVAA